jgi:hypothetical protein
MVLLGMNALLELVLIAACIGAVWNRWKIYGFAKKRFGLSMVCVHCFVYLVCQDLGGMYGRTVLPLQVIVHAFLLFYRWGWELL